MSENQYQNDFIPDLEVNTESKQQLDRVFRRIAARQKANTYKNRRVSIKQFAESVACDDLRDVETIHVDDWVDFMLSNGYAPRTVQSKVYCLSAVFSQLIKRGFVDENPVEDVDVEDYTQTLQGKYHTEENKKEYLTLEEYEKLVEATKNLRDEVLIRILWQTGVRVSEASEIRKSDLDRDERSIEIRNAKGSKYSEIETRKVYYDRKFSVLLKQYLDKNYRESFVGLSEEKEDNGHLLVSKERYKLNKQYITKFVAETAERAGIQEVMYVNKSGNPMNRVNAHILRKSYGVHRTKNGMPLSYLSDLMGHEDVETTKENYLTYIDEDIKEAERKYAP